MIAGRYGVRLAIIFCRRHKEVEMQIINLTQHDATKSQRDAGVVDLEGARLSLLKQLLTFDSFPTKEEIVARAEKIAEMAAESGCAAAMIGGAPWILSPLERGLRKKGIKPYYAFSARVVEEAVQQDGSVVKTSTFKHIDFIEAC